MTGISYFWSCIYKSVLENTTLALYILVWSCIYYFLANELARTLGKLLAL